MILSRYGGYGPSQRLSLLVSSEAGHSKYSVKVFTNNEGSSLYNDGYVNKTSLFTNKPVTGSGSTLRYKGLTTFIV